MRYRAILRIALWASAGFLVSAGWGFYFAYADKANPIPSIVNILVRLSQPAIGAVTVWYPDLSIGLSTAVAANVATYALLGLITETIRHRFRPESDLR